MKQRIFAFFVITLCMQVVIFLAVIFLFKESIRLDEAQSLWQTSHSFRKIFEIIGQDVHVPLYHIFLYYWYSIVGSSLFGVRMLSLFFYVLCIPASYFFAKMAFQKESIALYLSILTTLSPFLNWYGSELRMYSLLTLVTIASHYFFLRIIKKNDKLAWIGYLVAGLIGIYTHYFFSLNIITQAIFFVTQKKAFQKNSLIKFILTGFIIVLAIFPWLYFVKTLGSAGNTKPNLPSPSTSDIFNAYSSYIFGFHNDNINTIIVSFWPILVLIFFIILKKTDYIRLEIKYLIFSAIIPPTIVYIISKVYQPIFLSRYLIIVLPSIYLLISRYLFFFKTRIALYIRYIVVILFIFGLVQQTMDRNLSVKENFLDASSYISKHSTFKDVIALSAPFIIYPFEYYYNGPVTTTTIPFWNRFESGAIPVFSENDLKSQVLEMSKKYNNIWLLLSYDQGYQDTVRLYFDKNFKREEHKSFSGNVNLYVYRLKYD